jgi:hypothetical protein
MSSVFAPVIPDICQIATSSVHFRTALCVSEHQKSSFTAPNESVIVLFSSTCAMYEFGTKSAISRPYPEHRAG